MPSGSVLTFPVATADLHHEVELVVALGAGGSDVAAEDAEAMIFGYAVGLDMTRRDLQAVAKQKGRPWDMAKGFDHSAPIGPIVRGLPPREAAIRLTVDGKVRQQGNVDQMVWSIPEIIAHLSRLVRLAPGDLIFHRHAGGRRAGATWRAVARQHRRLSGSRDHLRTVGGTAPRTC